MGSIMKDSSERIRRFFVCFWNEVRIDVEGGTWIPMTEPAGNGTHVDASSEKARRHVMTKIVEADPRHIGLAADPLKRSGSRVRVPW